MRHLILPLLLLATALPAQANRSLDGVELKTTHVRGPVYMLEGVKGFAGGNIGVSAGADGILLVDAQFGGMADRIRGALSRIETGAPRLLLNTHWHRDHTEGNRAIGEGAVIIAHDNVRARVSTDQEIFGETVSALPERAWPMITFDDDLRIHFNGETLHFIHYPGSHTDGDGVVYFEDSNVLHMGDLFFNGSFPFIDLNAGGNALGLRDAVGAMAGQTNDDVLIIPGHGPLATRQDLLAYLDMLNETISWVTAQKAAERSLLEVQTQGLPREWDAWGLGFIKPAQWIQYIWTSLNHTPVRTQLDP